MTNEVKMLAGYWPEWYGNLGMHFIYIRIRHGQCWIGTGRSHPEAESKANVVRNSASLAGVSDIEDAIKELERAGYKVKSIVVPEHVKEL